MSKVLNTLVLVAAMLWSGVCFAECRILPSVSHAEAKTAIPPCHKQKQETAKPCVDPGACVLEVATKDHLQVAVNLSAVPIATAAAAPWSDVPVPVFCLLTPSAFRDAAGTPRPRTSVLRI